jgi:hypothetical protein
MADDQPPDEEGTSPPQPRSESRQNARPEAGGAPAIDFGAEVRKALDGMIQGGEIEIGTEQPPEPRRNWGGVEDDEARCERWRATREAKNKTDTEEKAFRDRITKKLDAKPRWHQPWRP